MLVASETARDGINIKNVLRGYIMTPTWHEAGMYQALSRFIRADSHDFLMLDNEYNEQNNGESPKIEIYRLHTNDTVDTKLYLDSELKNIRNSRLIKFMIECSFDGLINLERNLKAGKSNSVTRKDFLGKIELWNGNKPPPKSEYIYNTYYLYYVDKIIKRTKKQIVDIIRSSFFVDYEKLKEQIDAVDYVFNTAIQELVYNREIISNYQNTLFYNLDFNPSSNLLYMRRENLYNIKWEESTENDLYLDNPYPTLAKISYIGSDDEQITEFYSKFGNINESSAENIKNYYIETQNHLLFQKLLELALIKMVRNNSTSEAKETRGMNEIDQIILKMFSNYYLITKKPSGYYDMVDKAFSKESEKKQGRRRGEHSLAGLKGIDLLKIPKKETHETVVVHFYQTSEETAFAINTIFETDNRHIKILNTNSSSDEPGGIEGIDEFRDADRVESYIYNFMFTQIYNKILAPFKAVDYYGSYIMRGDSKSTIVEKEKNFFRIIDNTQDSSRGKVCTSFNIKKIEEILRYLDTKKKYVDIKKRKKPVICPLLLDLFREKKLLFESF